LCSKRKQEEKVFLVDFLGLSNLKIVKTKYYLRRKYRGNICSTRRSWSLTKNDNPWSAQQIIDIEAVSRISRSFTGKGVLETEPVGGWVLLGECCICSANEENLLNFF